MTGCENPPVDVSIVAACLNEAGNVVPLADALAAELVKAKASYEIIFIDNGSTDGTIDLIKTMCARDDKVRLIVNNKNYGYMRSPAHGIYQASGRAVVGMCSDFQDPPALIGEFIARWRGGARIVLGVRQSEQTSTLLRIVRAIGYGFFERFGDYRVIPGATGYGLYDREVVECLRRWRDPEPFWRGMLVESGYPLETVPYHRPPRAGGETKNDFGSLLGFALSGLASSSKKLLRLPLYLSIVVLPVGILILALEAVIAVTGLAGWRWFVLGAGLFGFGLIFLFLGLIGEQVRLISEMARNVPLVTEKERVNFPPHPDPQSCR